MLIPVIPVTIPDLSKPPQAGFYFRLLLVVKLLLFSLLVPALYALATEQLVSFVNWVYGETIYERPIPIVTNLLSNSFWLVVAFVLMAGMTTVFLPFLQPLWIIPWTLLCTIAGLLVEIVVIVPRMFLGYFLDCFLFGKVKKDSTIMFSRRATLLLAVLLPVIAISSSYLWSMWYSP